MLRRLVSAVLGAAAIGNGLLMLIAGRRWFESMPAVVDTGPYNPHFVADVGAAFVVGGLALLARAWRPRLWPAAAAGAGFFAAHGLIHLAGLASGHAGHALFEIVVVIAPSAIAVWAALPSSGEIRAWGAGARR